MTEVTVRALGGEDWQAYRQVRLAALQESPHAFVSTHAEESQYDEAFWRLRMQRSARLLAEDGDAQVGIVSVGNASEPDVGELFGMWVTPDRRGSGIAWRLTAAAARWSAGEGRRGLKLWVSSDNPRALAFFSSYGFRPTDERRPMHGDEDVDELAMVLPLGDSPGFVPGEL